MKERVEVRVKGGMKARVKSTVRLRVGGVGGKVRARAGKREGDSQDSPWNADPFTFLSRRPKIGDVVPQRSQAPARDATFEMCVIHHRRAPRDRAPLRMLLQHSAGASEREKGSERQQKRTLMGMLLYFKGGRLVAVGGWLLAVDGDWRRWVIDNCWGLAVGGWQRLAAVGSWRLVVGRLWGPSLRAVLHKNKIWLLKWHFLTPTYFKNEPV